MGGRALNSGALTLEAPETTKELPGRSSIKEKARGSGPYQVVPGPSG